MHSTQRGQTLVETMVAVFVMVMGITAALGLANYSLNASTSIRKQIIGMGLAREGLEAVKNMRDTNWLNGTLSTNCYYYPTSSNAGNCYRDWLNAPGAYNFQLSPPAARSYILTFNGAQSSGTGFWNLLPAALGNTWAMNTSTDPNSGLYAANGGISGTSGFYRKITITPQTAVPFDRQTSGSFDWPRLLVESQVWWIDKNCPINAGWPGPGKCSIQLQSYLTNWKTY